MFNKKMIAGIAMVVTVAVSASMFAAFEAHVINVTAKIENALTVDTTPIEFGTVFPEEVLYSSPINMKLSESFMAEDRVDDVEYMIRQKPKCALFDDANGTIIEYGRVTEDASGNFICVDAGFVKLPVLCPFLSKTPDNLPENDGSLAAFHGSITDWTMADTLATQVLGRLAKSDDDFEDNWIIDLHVPCFAGSCAQDYVVPKEYEIDPALEHEQFGCDLWIEVTGISESNGEDLGCADADVMLVLDRSGSVETELTTLQTAAKAFVTALAPESDGVWMGQTSFADYGSLDLGLSHDVTAINSAIDGLTSGGWTNLAEGLTLATTELVSFDRTSDVDYPDYMVVITDGAPNYPEGEEAAKAAAALAADAARAAGIKIYVVGVGTDSVTADYLSASIANHTGQYYDAADYASLSVILADIATCN